MKDEDNTAPATHSLHQETGAAWDETAANDERGEQGDYFSTTLNDRRWPMPFLDRQECPANALRARGHQ